MPALMVGAAGAIAAEVAVAILLYAGPGLMRSLTTVLAVEAAALAAGLRTMPAQSADLLSSIRRRWLFSLCAFMAAALFGTSWSMFEVVGGGRLGQGLGLALLAGLPLFAYGAVLAGMSAASLADTSGRLRPPAPAAAFGAALGFVATGLLLPRAPIPASLLVGCLVLLSGSGMVYGAVLADVAAAAQAELIASTPIDGETAAEEGDEHVDRADGAEVAAVGSPDGDVPAR